MLKEIALPPLDPPLNLMSFMISVKFLRKSDTNMLAESVGMMGLVTFNIGKFKNDLILLHGSIHLPLKEEMVQRLAEVKIPH